MPLFLVVLLKTPKSKGNLLSLIYWSKWRVLLSPYENKRRDNVTNARIISNEAGCDPRCMKCAGNHWSRDCPKPKETPATCLHCKGDHTYTIQAAPETPKQKSFPTAPANAWSDPAALAKVGLSPKSDSRNSKAATHFAQISGTNLIKCHQVKKNS
ncbi:hypothetical protein AVEN_121587-1 [Araneus ventricosus]|uniref:CCHC-type domain-containing protein n=1 Tax=Araneus ventricosus TaxID=182803 RepID=A0A4Y2VXN1_ARAVE|nr:hypothetical protein AVEN_121587-1 [Araneus ventricosus]